MGHEGHQRRTHQEVRVQRQGGGHCRLRLLLQEGQPHHAPSLWQGPHHRPGLAQDDPCCLWQVDHAEGLHHGGDRCQVQEPELCLHAAEGNAEMRGVFPVVFDYVVKYNIKDAMEHQGKAKMKFDGKTPAKKFEMSFAPKTGTPMDLIWNMDFSSGFKYDYDFKMNAVTMEKGNGEYKWVNNGQKFELM